MTLEQEIIAERIIKYFQIHIKVEHDFLDDIEGVSIDKKIALNWLIEYRYLDKISDTIFQAGEKSKNFISFDDERQKAQDKLNKEEERQRKQDQLADLSIDKLVDEIIKSPKVENRLFRAEIIAAVSAGAAILSLILGLKGC